MQVLFIKKYLGKYCCACTVFSKKTILCALHSAVQNLLISKPSSEQEAKKTCQIVFPQVLLFLLRANSLRERRKKLGRHSSPSTQTSAVFLLPSLIAQWTTVATTCLLKKHASSVGIPLMTIHKCIFRGGGLLKELPENLIVPLKKTYRQEGQMSTFRFL